MCFASNEKWRKKIAKGIDRAIRKLMTLHKALHPRNDIDNMC